MTLAHVVAGSKGRKIPFKNITGQCSRNITYEEYGMVMMQSFFLGAGGFSA